MGLDKAIDPLDRPQKAPVAASCAEQASQFEESRIAPGIALFQHLRDRFLPQKGGLPLLGHRNWGERSRA